MATMPEQFLEQNFTNKPDNHVAYKSMNEINNLGRSQTSGLSGMQRFEAEMQVAGLSAMQIGDYCVVYRNNLTPRPLW